MKTLRFAMLAFVLSLLTVAGCDTADKPTHDAFVANGFSDSVATELSKTNLNDREVKEVIHMQKTGLDENVIASMVTSLKKANLDFDIGADAEVLTRAGINATALTQLVEMGAVPRWTDDIRALKDVGVDDVTIVEIARYHFDKGHDVLSGNEYAMLKRRGLSDAGLLAFVRADGDRKQLQQVADAIQLGTPEQQALDKALK